MLIAYLTGPLVTSALLLNLPIPAWGFLGISFLRIMEPAAKLNVADAAATTAATMTFTKDQKIWEGPREGPTETLRGMKSAVREAGNAALALQRAGLSRMEKDGFYDIVTEGDITSQRVAMGGLGKHPLSHRLLVAGHASFPDETAKVFPELPFLAEESDDQAMVPGVPQSRVDADGSIHARDYLALDPVDGTTNFASGGPDWGVTGAVVRRDTGPTHGVIYLPKKDIMVEAAKGHGCRVNGEIIDFRESQLSQKVLQGTIVAAEIGKFIPDDRLQRLLRLVNHCMGIRNLFSSTGNTADVLSGIHGAWVHLKGGSVWDFAAGALAIEEAGGFVCDLQGQPLKWDKLKMEVVFAVNEQIARDVVRILDVAEET